MGFNRRKTEDQYRHNRLRQAGGLSYCDAGSSSVAHMSDDAAYRWQAQTALDKAERAATRNDKTVWVIMARAWAMLAAGAEAEQEAVATKAALAKLSDVLDTTNRELDCKSGGSSN